MTNSRNRVVAHNRRVPLTGYTDRLSVRPGDTLAFKLSATGYNSSNPARVRTWLSQSICADPNPKGPGIVERNASAWYENAECSVVEQSINAGSCALSSPIPVPESTSKISMQVTLWPTHLNSATQCVMTFGAMSLSLSTGNTLQCKVGTESIIVPMVLKERQWFRATLMLCAKGSDIEFNLRVASLTDARAGVASAVVTEHTSKSTLTFTSINDLFNANELLSLASRLTDNTCTEHFNGKLEAPLLQIDAKNDNSLEASTRQYRWNFSNQMSSCTINDSDEHDIALKLYNMPARAMKASTWTGEEMCWRHRPEHYAAIHFHDDDLVDMNWETTFTYSLPENMPSGVYVMHVSDGEHEDAMPFFLCAPKGKPSHRVCVLVSTFTYAIYGNHARPDWAPFWRDKMDSCNAYPYNPAEYPGYGLSTYNYHGDGSGICHASHHRPLFNLRPGYITFGNTSCSGLRHFQADSHLLSWLDAMDIGFDIITDRELHDEGVACISQYDVLLTGSHPEYHTPETLNALSSFRDSGGHLSYLGGNGFYWRIAIHPEHDDTLEIRRAEAGIRAWAAEPGEYYHAFDGQYGGLWRRNGRPPQALVGLGFSAQGEFNGSHYRRCNFEAEHAWIFKGIDDDVIGNFGLCGGGAAGFELDRADTRLGTPENAVVLASSEAHSKDFILVPEEMLTHLTTLPGPAADELIRADIIWFDVPDGGSVFSVGSITFCGSLPHNNFDNSVSRMLRNVVERCLGSAFAGRTVDRIIKNSTHLQPEIE